MLTQTAERQELLQVTGTFPDDRVGIILDFAKSLRNEIPNAETQEAMAELRAGGGGTAHSIEELMAALHEEDDDD